MSTTSTISLSTSEGHYFFQPDEIVRLEASSNYTRIYFTNKKISSSLPDNSYLPGLNSADLTTVLPPFIYDALAGGLKAFGKKLKGYYTNDAILVATESRTSSPVRIPRDPETLNHPQAKNLYPCAEGAGYAGGIVSAAMDGERVAAVIIAKLIS